MYRGGLPIPATWGESIESGPDVSHAAGKELSGGGRKDLQGIKRSLMECLDEGLLADHTQLEETNKGGGRTVGSKITKTHVPRSNKNNLLRSPEHPPKHPPKHPPTVHSDPVVENDDTMYDGGTASVYDSTNPKLSMTPSIRKQQDADMSTRTVGVTLSVISEAIRSSKTFENKSKLCDLNLDTVLSSTSYASLMRQMFGTEGSILPSTGGSSNEGGAHPRTTSITIPTITRAFEESYMREPMANERECARGSKCECQYIDSSQPFTCVEFLTIDEIANPPPDNQLCVICSRKETQYLYYDMTFNKKVYNSVIQRYGNISGGGEYAPECLIRCTKQCDLACMPKPIMSHQRNRYRVYKNHENGTISLKQTRVSPQDYVSSANLDNPVGILNSTVCTSLSTTETNAAGHARPGKSRGF